MIDILRRIIFKKLKMLKIWLVELIVLRMNVEIRMISKWFLDKNLYPKILQGPALTSTPHTHIVRATCNHVDNQMIIFYQYSLSLTQVTRNVLHCTLHDNEKGQKLKKQSLAAKTSDMALKRFE